ncbi:hypothetical protein HUU05_21290 [candidate division KSB1 bacterium]|nr:hypothetical protein [candidate division KSB1 bacterium]
MSCDFEPISTHFDRHSGLRARGEKPFPLRQAAVGISRPYAPRRDSRKAWDGRFVISGCITRNSQINSRAEASNENSFYNSQVFQCCGGHAEAEEAGEGVKRFHTVLEMTLK